MTTSDTLLGPILGAALGALGATIAAVIGAVVVTRLSRTGKKINDIELRNEPEHTNRPRQQDGAQIGGAYHIHFHRRKLWQDFDGISSEILILFVNPIRSTARCWTGCRIKIECIQK
ncbi:hypothetical protein GGR58DRAFT_508034 [Xylaria digitata]|nr:hypothetical protein GGR58DRAFT_508034 [Xylaria digitata]